jgi:hypothetical protein
MCRLWTVSQSSMLCKSKNNKQNFIIWCLESELLYDWQFITNQFCLAPSSLRLTTSNFFSINPCGHSPHGTSSLMRGWVSHLQLLLTIMSTVVLGSKSRGTHDHWGLENISVFWRAAGNDKKQNDNGKAIWTEKSLIRVLILGANHGIKMRTVVFTSSKRSVEDGKQKHFFLQDVHKETRTPPHHMLREVPYSPRI